MESLFGHEPARVASALKTCKHRSKKDGISDTKGKAAFPPTWTLFRAHNRKSLQNQETQASIGIKKARYTGLKCKWCAVRDSNPRRTDS